MDSQKWPQRGNKLFLPKIEYSRLENTTESWNMKMDSDSSEFVAEETIEGNDSDGSTSPMVEHSDRTGSSFTKFSVLPPIQGKQSSKGIPNHHKKRQSQNVANPASSEESYYKKKGSFLHRQTALLTGDREAITLQKTNTDNLKIVGKRYSGHNNMGSHQQTVITMDGKNRSGKCNSLSRPSTTPNETHLLEWGSKTSVLSDNEYENGFQTSYTGLIPQTDRTNAQQTGRRLSKFRRFNSDTSNEGKIGNSEDLHSYKNGSQSLLSSRSILPKANLLYPDNTGIDEKWGLISNCRSPRPISRCHIDINMNEAENISLKLTDDRKVSGGTSDITITTDVPNSSEPFIEISTEGNSHSEDRQESQNPPSIEILINSLDSAKEETLQDEKLELPKMSVREQRRRSALCRANSKQVDDFLLVHNLRDLGLL